MIKVSLQYRPIPLLPLTRRVSTMHAERWGELNHQQLADVCSCIDQGKISAENRMLLIGSFLKLKGRLFAQLDSEQVMSLLSLSDFIVKEQFLKTWIVPNISIRKGIKKHVFYGPQSELRYMTIGEFAFVDSYYLLYEQTQNMDFADKLIAVLYRKKVSDKGDVRESFDERDVEKRARLIKPIRADLKRALIMNYSSVRKWIASQYPYVFPEPSDGDDVSTDRKNTIPQWNKVFVATSNGRLSDIDANTKVYLHTFMVFYDQELKPKPNF